MEKRVPKKIVPGVKRVPAVNIHENYFGFYVSVRLTQQAIDHRRIQHATGAHKISDVQPKTSSATKLLDLLGLVNGDLRVIHLDDKKQLRVKRHGLESFTVFVDEFFNEKEAKVGDKIEVHFRFINGEFSKATIRVVNKDDRDDDFEFAEIISSTQRNLQDPIWKAGAALIEKALRVTNPEDPLFYGHKSGSLSFWSYRSYNAREENYVQWRWNSVGELYIEACSNKYAWPKIPIDGVNHLLETGWSGPSEDEDDDLPNFFRTYEEVDAKKIADDIMKVFRDVYFIKRDWIWLFQPFRLVEELFDGETEDDFRFKPEAFHIYDKEQTYERRCEMGVQLSEDVLLPKGLQA